MPMAAAVSMLRVQCAPACQTPRGHSMLSTACSSKAVCVVQMLPGRTDEKNAKSGTTDDNKASTAHAQQKPQAQLPQPNNDQPARLQTPCSAGLLCTAAAAAAVPSAKHHEPPSCVYTHDMQ